MQKQEEPEVLPEVKINRVHRAPLYNIGYIPYLYTIYENSTHTVLQLEYSQLIQAKPIHQ